MFTGIVQGVGRIRSVDPHGCDVRMWIETDDVSLAGVEIGGSIAVNGACLTAVQLEAAAFAADLSRETLALTTALQPDKQLTDELREEKIAIPANVQFYSDRLRESMKIVSDLVPKELMYSNEWAQLVATVFVRNTIPLSRLGYQKKKENAQEARRAAKGRI